MPTKKRLLKVFLCHASQDKPVVRELCQKLAAQGWIDPWLDEEKLLPGQDWDIEIENAVEVADAVIVCLSNNSVTKEGYVQKELRFVLDIADEKLEGAIFAVPLRLDDCPLPRRLRKWQSADFYPIEKRERAVEKLIASLLLRANYLKRKSNFELSKNVGIKLEPKDDKDFEKAIIIWDSKLGFHPRPANQILSSARKKLESSDISNSLGFYSMLIDAGVLLEFVIGDLEEAANNDKYATDELILIFETLSSAYKKINNHLKAIHYQNVADKYRGF